MGVPPHPQSAPFHFWIHLCIGDDMSKYQNVIMKFSLKGKQKFVYKFSTFFVWPRIKKLLKQNVIFLGWFDNKISVLAPFFKKQKSLFSKSP